MTTDHATPESPPPPDPLAIALAKLDPAPHGFDRDALMFAAGRESKMRLLGFWRTLAIVATILALTFATLYFLRPTVPGKIDRSGSVNSRR
jgi:hypothetical protein